MIKLKVSAANIAVEEKETLTEGRVGLQCRFSFTGEWDGLAKTAVFDGADSRDVILTEDTVAVPAECLAAEGYSLSVGVYGKNAAGDIVIPTVYATVGKIQRSAYPSGKETAAPTPDVVAQIQQAAANAETMARSVREDADLGKFNGGQGPQGPAGATGPKGDTGAAGEDGGYYAPSVDDEGNLTWTASKTDMPAVDGANIKGPKGDTGATGAQGPAGATGPAGADGKSAYQYAQDGGFTGTEAEFAAKLAKEIPETLPNPNALTFTGAVTGSYDGSAPVSVEIPSGGLTVTNTAAVGQTVRITDVDENGQPAAWEAVEFTGGDVWELLYETTLTEDAATFSQEIPTCSKVKMVIFPGADVSGFKQIVINGITYPALSSSLTKNQAFFVSIDTLTPPYITVATGIYYRPSVNGINGGNSASSYAMIDDSITTIGCGTAAILVTGTIVKIWGVRE
ncbi:MAG: collagen-like protein [Clostridiales bacterium]|nr:collagen-like protein [Clostridiales bacterium]